MCRSECRGKRGEGGKGQPSSDEYGVPIPLQQFEVVPTAAIPREDEAQVVCKSDLLTFLAGNLWPSVFRFLGAHIAYSQRSHVHHPSALAYAPTWGGAHLGLVKVT